MRRTDSLEKSLMLGKIEGRRRRDDILRWKDAATVLNKPVQGVKIRRSGTGYTYTTVDIATRTFNNANYYLPFMRSEIQNSGGTLEQNPGY